VLRHSSGDDLEIIEQRRLRQTREVELALNDRQT